MRKKIARMAAGTLCLALTVGAVGCGNANGETKTVQEATEQESTNQESIVQENTEKENAEVAGTVAKISDNGKSITDFDEFVNGEWKADQEKKNIGSVYIHDEEGKIVYDRTLEILNDTDLDSLSQDTGLYKVVSIYKRLLDTSDSDKRFETARRHLEPIEKVKTLDDLYALYADEQYSAYNTVLKFTVKADPNGYNTYFFDPRSYTGSLEYHYNLVTGEQSDNTLEARNEFLAFMKGLGYSEDRTKEILENSLIIGKMIDEYLSGVGNDLDYYEKKDLDESGVTVPVIDIYANLNSLWKKRRLAAGDNFTDFLNKTYQEENALALRDYYIFSVVSAFINVSGDKVLMAESGIEYSQIVSSVFMQIATDVLCREYQNRYFEKDTLDNAKAMAEEVKDAMRELISESEWLSPHGKELAKHKLMTMHECYGVNGAANDFEDVTLTDDVAEDYISLLVSNRKFNRSQVSFEDDKREIIDADLFEVNGRFFDKYNGFYITNALLGAKKFEGDEAYEEKLAFFGEVIAHEIAHSFDPEGIEFNWKGYVDSWLTDDEAASYAEIISKIESSCDGMETEYGYKIDGGLVSSEVFADIFAMECCLRILENKENPDYDLFFRTYAREHARYYDAQGAETAVKDEHLPSKQRINYCLGQFDKFYEVYDIDEASPYYVPIEKRIHVF